MKKTEYYDNGKSTVKVELYEPDYDFSKSHTFNVGVAHKYGVEESIMLYHLSYWVDHNRANNKNNFNGYYWTYNTLKAFAELFPYWSEKQIRRILDNLEKKGAILTGNHNKSAYDRTKWYTVIDPAICPNGQMDNPKKANRFAEKGGPIPYINTDVKQNNNCDVGEPTPPPSSKQNNKAIEILEYLNQKRKSIYPKSRGLTTSKANLKNINARLKDYTPEELKTVIDSKCRDDFFITNDYLYPDNLFNADKFEKHLNKALNAPPVQQLNNSTDQFTEYDQDEEDRRNLDYLARCEWLYKKYGPDFERLATRDEMTGDWKAIREREKGDLFGGGR